MEQGQFVFDQLWPEARAVSDVKRELYKEFGIRRGGFLALAGPAVWKSGRRAKDKGYSQGDVVGDPFLMPGAFLVREGTVIWRSDPDHAGDTLRLEELEQALEHLG